MNILYSLNYCVIDIVKLLSSRFEVINTVVIMMTSSNGNIFRVTGHLCEEFTGHPTGEFLTQRPVRRSFDVFFDMRLNKHFSKQSWGWWFETLLRPLWRHSNGYPIRQFAPRTQSIPRLAIDGWWSKLLPIIACWTDIPDYGIISALSWKRKHDGSVLAYQIHGDVIGVNISITICSKMPWYLPR